MMLARLIVAVLLLTGGLGVMPGTAQWRSERRAWNAPLEPQQLAGNLYYVGTAELAAYLLTGPSGHVVIDGGLPESAPLVLAAIRRLGFRPEDVRLLLNSHAHFDHAGGLKELKRATGATLAATTLDAELLERGGRGDFALGDSAPYPPVTVDRRLHDGDSVVVGDLMLTAHLTPGHTKGCTTWTTTIREGERQYRVVFVCSLSVLPFYRLEGDRGYPDMLTHYRRSIRVVRELPCEIMLAPHASFIEGFQDKLGRIRARGTADPLVDRDACRRYADQAERRLEAEWHTQQQKPARAGP